jgi:GNAT superfamily N-acetyltransferase
VVESNQLVDLRIRPSSGWEDSQLEQVFKAAVLEQCATHYTPTQLTEILNTNNPRCQPSPHIFLVAECDRQIVGFGTLWFYTVNALFVDPVFSRRGIGRQLLAALERYACARGSRFLEVTASLNAMPFYRACGFIPYAEQERPWISGSLDLGFPTVKLAKAIGRAGTTTSEPHQQELSDERAESCSNVPHD